MTMEVAMNIVSKFLIFMMLILFIELIILSITKSRLIKYGNADASVMDALNLKKAKSIMCTLVLIILCVLFTWSMGW